MMLGLRVCRYSMARLASSACTPPGEDKTTVGVRGHATAYMQEAAALSRAALPRWPSQAKVRVHNCQP